MQSAGHFQAIFPSTWLFCMKMESYIGSNSDQTHELELTMNSLRQNLGGQEDAQLEDTYISIQRVRDVRIARFLRKHYHLTRFKVTVKK